jgi:hypothetical protein
VAGSRDGTGGISIRPAPRLPRVGRDERPDLVVPDRLRPLLVLVTPVLPDRPEPDGPDTGDAGAAATPHTLQ